MRILLRRHALPKGDSDVRTPPRILVVDDNRTNIKIVQTRLANEGYDIVTAVDGEEALAAAHEQQPDLILLDIMMPKLDGIEVCKRLRADPQFPFTPIILVTAMADTKDVIAGLDAGADEYLTKPIDHGNRHLGHRARTCFARADGARHRRQCRYRPRHRPPRPR